MLCSDNHVLMVYIQAQCQLGKHKEKIRFWLKIYRFVARNTTRKCREFSFKISSSVMLTNVEMQSQTVDIALIPRCNSSPIPCTSRNECRLIYNFLVFQ